MYSYEDRVRAVKLYIKLGKRTRATIRQLGYPTKNSLKNWHEQYEQLSEKVIQRLMMQECLVVAKPKRRRYGSYLGEISPAPENLIKRDCTATAPNEKWLTGWRQLPWPVDDNYLGRFDAIAGQVLEAGYCEPIELQRRLTFCPARRSRTTKCRSTNNTASSSTRSLLRPRLA
jgi:hypothetical protein